MVATLAQLGARALRKLGVQLIANAARPADGPVNTAEDVAGDVMQILGVIIPPSDRPDLQVGVRLDIGSGDDMVARLLRHLGIFQLVPAPVSAQPPVSMVNLAKTALIAIGVNPAFNTSAAFAANGIGTQVSLATAALVKLAVIASDETPSAEDLAYAVLRTNDAHDALAGLDLVMWTLNTVPGALIEAYIMMIANLMAPAFGKQGSLEAYNAGVQMVRQYDLSGARGQVIAESKVLELHEELTAKGLVYWPSNAIPLAATNAYVKLTAALLAPIMGQKVDRAEIQEAENDLHLMGLMFLARPQSKLKLQDVHDSLTVQGLVNWDIDSIPPSMVEDYLAMAGALMAPVLARPLDDKMMAATKGIYDAAQANIRKRTVDLAIMNKAVDNVKAYLSELNAAGLVDWDENHIPAALGDAIATTVAMLMPTVPKPINPQTWQLNESRIWRVGMGGLAGQKLAEQKVFAIQQYLEARGMARWTIWDIPVWAEEPIVCMAAVWLAPDCRTKADPNWWAASEHLIHRVIELPSDGSQVIANYL